MREITEIQKRLEKVSLDLKQSQYELRELSGKLAELERNLDKKSKPVETVQKNEKKKDNEPVQIKGLKIYTEKDFQRIISTIDYSFLLYIMFNPKQFRNVVFLELWSELLYTYD